MRPAIVISVVTVVSFAVFACSSPESTQPSGTSKSADANKPSGSSSSSSSGASSSSGGSSSGTPSGSSSTSSGAPSTTSSSSTSGAPAGGACTLAQGEDACFTCCDQGNPKGLAKRDQLDDTYDSCICGATGTGGVCATQCAATECSDTGPDPVDGDACSTCMDNADVCNDPDEAACDADADCKALEACYEICDP